MDYYYAVLIFFCDVFKMLCIFLPKHLFLLERLSCLPDILIKPLSACYSDQQQLLLQALRWYCFDGS